MFRRSVLLWMSVLLLGSLGLAAAVFGQEPAAPVAQAAPTVHRVLAPRGLIAGQPGVQLWHDYGPFALYRVTDAALAGFSADVRRQIETEATLDRIEFDRQPFNTQTDRLQLPAALRLDAPVGSALQLVQFVGPIKDQWLDELKLAGVTPVHYIANNGYLVWADAPGRSALDRLVADGNFLQYSAPYQPAFKLGRTLSERIEKGLSKDAELVDVTVQIYRHAGQAATESAVAAAAVAQQSDWTPVLGYQNIAVTIPLGAVTALAQRGDVTYIGERLPRELLDEVQGQIVAGNLNGSQTGPSGTGYLGWLNGFGFSQNPADYPIVDIVDDGVGTGAAATAAGDSTFTVLQAGAVSRVAYINNCTTAATGGAGVDGHGHINASIALGYDNRSGFPFQDPNGYRRGLGINPYGRIAGTRVFGPSFSLTNCGGTDTGLIKAQQDRGALISSNSWGCSGCAGSYDDSSQAFDVGTRDADLTEPGNQEMLFVFAAGNSGPGAGTVGTPGNGKNMITVGASENQRPSDESGSWTDGCGIGPSGADNAMDVISFSSRGPSPGNRKKPEVIAPGTHIQGTASTFPGYTGNSVCDQYRPGGQTTFAASSGTSHSTPAVAGITSLYYYWLQNTHGVTAPSPALLKAYTIGHPTYLTGVSANDTLPSNSQGYGMPNMNIAFDNASRYLLNQTHVFGNTGEQWTWTGAAVDPTKPVRIVLVYTDQAGAIGTSPQVNNLDLAATIGGNTYLGNVFSGRWSVTGGAADNLNNYEAIFLPAGTIGQLDITITAANIAGDGVPNNGDPTDQDFALVCYNCIQEATFVQTTAPETQEICIPNNADYTVTIGQLLGYQGNINLSAVIAPAGPTASFSVNPVAVPGSSVLTLATGAATTGSYTIDVIGSSPTRTITNTVGLTLFETIPAVPTLVTPPNGSIDQSTTPTFVWSPSVASSYLLEVATDPGFTNIILSQTTTAATYTMQTSLDPVTTYYWRATALNACGNNGPSAVFSFTTANIVCATYPSTNVPLPIPPTGTSGVTNSTLAIANSGSIIDVNVVNLVGTHTWVGDLRFSLVSPAGTTVTLLDRVCSSQDNFNINFDDDAVGAPPCPPTDGGTYPPVQPLAAFNGQEQAGTWTLVIADLASGDSGNLQSWGLEICAETIPDFELEATPAAQAVCAGTDADFNIAITPMSGYADPVTLSVSGQPAGTTAGFTPNPVTGPGWQSVLTIGNTSAAAPGDYTLTVDGLGGSGLRSDTVTLSVSAAAPGAPTLLAPAAGAMGVVTNPTFSWTAMPGALEYQIVVATDPDFVNIVAAATVAGTSFTPAAPLAVNTVHYWRVTAANGCGQGTSMMSAFMTVTPSAICSTPDLAIPDNSVTGVTDTLVVAAGQTLTDLDVSINALHTWVGDLVFTVEHVESGISVTIIDRPGVPASTFGCSADNINAILDDEGTDGAAETTCNTTPPALSGRLTPNNPLSAFDGVSLAGTWRMTASDRAAGDTGRLVQWCLEPTPGLGEPMDFSDLPASYGVAWHPATPDGLRLGDNWTADSSFGPGDDDANDDIVVGALQIALPNDIPFDVQNDSGWLQVWFDWNADGQFDGSELVFNAAVNEGPQVLTVTPPPSTAIEPLAYRFRLHDVEPTGAPSPHGGSTGGEVEDGYAPPPDPTAVGLAQFSTANPAYPVILATTAVLLTVALWVVLRRRGQVA